VITADMAWHVHHIPYSQEDHIMCHNIYTTVRIHLLPLAALLLVTAGLGGCVAYSAGPPTTYGYNTYPAGTYSYNAYPGGYYYTAQPTYANSNGFRSDYMPGHDLINNAYSPGGDGGGG
jgi:hypothetical protein